jgi:hypothetical protein
MGLRGTPRGFTAAMTPLRASAHRTLLTPESLLRCAIVTRVLNRVPFTISKEDFQTHVNADIRMITSTWLMLCLWLRLTDDQGIPMSIGTQDKMDRLRCSLKGAVQFDLEKVSDLLWDNEVFLLLMQGTIFPILSQLDGMPAMWLLETRKPDTGDSMFLGRNKAFERFRQAISQHLDGCGRDMFPLPFESGFQIILAGERPIMLIRSLDGLKHAIVNDARLDQALHEQVRLFLIHKEAIFKRFHLHILPQMIRKRQGQGTTHPKPQTRNAFFTPMAEDQGPSKAI